jgi:hypothetical protein
MQSSDKAVIHSMIGADKTLDEYSKSHQESEKDAMKDIEGKFKYSWDIMDGK